jgi:hypothetical protein
LREFPVPIFCGSEIRTRFGFMHSDRSVFSRGLFALKTGIGILKPNQMTGVSYAKSKENMGRKDEGKTAP